MKNLVFGLSTIGALFLTSSHVDARMLTAMSDWSVNKVDAAMPYCTLARQYEAGAVVTFARNAKGEATIAIDFQRDAFDVTRPYPVTLRAGSVLRQYVVRPANKSTIIMRTSTDESLFDGMSASSRLNIQIDSEKFDLDLSGYQSAFKDMNNCAGVGKKVVVASTPKTELPVQKVEVNTPRPPVVQDNGYQQNNQIAELLEENRRLTSLLSEQVKAVAKPQPDTSSAEEKIALMHKLADAEKRNVKLIQRVNILEQQIEKQKYSMNPNMDDVIAGKDAQIASLQSQNASLKQAVENAKMVEPQVIVKEVIKEVPVMAEGVSSDNAEMAMRLADAETQAMSFKAERDEYRRLLQTERQRLKDMGTMAEQIQSMDGQSTNLLDDIARLEAEKVELIRELEFVKSSVNPSTDAATVDKKRVAELTQKLNQSQSQLSQLQIDKQVLKAELAQAEMTSAKAQQKLASMSVKHIASQDSDAEKDAMRVEISSLEAQNLTLREDIARLNAREPEVIVKEIVKTVEVEKTDRVVPAVPVQEVGKLVAANIPTLPKIETMPEPVNKITGKVTQSEARKQLRAKLQNRAPKPSAPIVPQKVAMNVPSSPVEIVKQPAKVVSALSGDDIRQLVFASRIPLETQIGRVDRVSGPDFAAFKWDTGFVYGSAEQSKLSNMAAFESSVQQYLNKTESRCSGAFDKTIVPVRSNSGLSVKAADIACIGNNGDGHAASILFFAKAGMFYALAHETDMNGFEIAMDMRERLSGALGRVF